MEKKHWIKTIFYEDDDKQGLRVDELDYLFLVDLPRNIINDSLNQLEINQIDLLNNAGIYFLINDEIKDIYIGKSAYLFQRCDTHDVDKKKKFNRIIYFVNTNKLDSTKIDYLEWYFINLFINDNSNLLYSLTNKNKRSKEPYIDDYTKDEIYKIIDKILIFLKYKNIILFSKQVIKNDDNVFSYEGTIFPSFELISNMEDIDQKSREINEKRIKEFEKLQKISKREDDCWETLENIIIGYPTTASKLVNWKKTANGWKDYKNKDGKTLDSVYRSSSSDILE